MGLLLEGIPSEVFERNKQRIREPLDWVVRNGCDLASLREVEPDDSVSYVAARTNPFESTLSKLHISGLSMIDEIFGLSSDLDIEGDTYFKLTY